MSIRVNVAAAIVRDNQILLVECDDKTVGLHYNFPGGGVEYGEGLHEALEREVKEETGARLAHIGETLLIWEYIPVKCSFKYGEQQKIAMLFRCELAEGSEPHMTNRGDEHQIGVKWQPLEELQSISLIPSIAPQLLAALQGTTGIREITDGGL